MEELLLQFFQFPHSLYWSGFHLTVESSFASICQVVADLWPRKGKKGDLVASTAVLLLLSPTISKLNKFSKKGPSVVC